MKAITMKFCSGIPPAGVGGWLLLPQPTPPAECVRMSRRDTAPPAPSRLKHTRMQLQGRTRARSTRRHGNGPTAGESASMTKSAVDSSVPATVRVAPRCTVCRAGRNDSADLDECATSSTYSCRGTGGIRHPDRMRACRCVRQAEAQSCRARETARGDAGARQGRGRGAGSGPRALGARTRSRADAHQQDEGARGARGTRELHVCDLRGSRYAPSSGGIRPRCAPVHVGSVCRRGLRLGSMARPGQRGAPALETVA